MNASGSMGPVYLRALLGAVPGRKKSSPHMPSRVIERTHVLDAEAVAGFQRVIGGRVQDVVPPAYLHVLGFPESMRLMTDPGFPLSVLGMVHIANGFTALRAVRVGESVTVAVQLGRPHAHPRGTAVQVLVSGTVDGEVVFREVSTYLAKGTTLPGVAPALPEERAEFVAPEVQALWRLTPEIGPRYARVSGDYNPIHLNPLAAKAFGFPRTIAHGMLTAARGFEAAGVRADAFTWDVQFAKPVLLPGKVAYAVVPADHAADVTADAAASNGSGPGSENAEAPVAYEIWNPKSGKPHVRGRITPAQG